MPRLQARHVMYTLLFGFQQSNMFVWRGLTAQVMSFILQEFTAWRPAQVAFLLGSFSLGYVPLQIPYSLLARRTGPKILCTVNLLAQAAGCWLVPAAAAAGPACLSCVYAALGVFQGSRVPCHQVLTRRWVPDGIERVRFQQFTSWGTQAVTLLHLSLIPILAKRIGWRVLPRWYAVQSLLMAGLWHAFAADSPAEWRGPVPISGTELQLLASIGGTPTTSTSPEEVAVEVAGEPLAAPPAIFLAMTQQLASVGGLSTEGIFRIPGPKAEVDRILLLLLAGCDSEEAQAEAEAAVKSCSDVHTLGSLLRAWLREQPAALIPASEFGTFGMLESRHRFNAVGLEKLASRTIVGGRDHDGDLEVATCSAAEACVSALPTEGQALLRALVSFLQQIDGEASKMTVDNLGVVFAPTLFPREDPYDMMQNVKSDGRVVSVLVQALLPVAAAAAAAAATEQATGEHKKLPLPLAEKDLPPLSMGQLFRVRQIQGMVGMCCVECLFPTFTKVQALWTLYFSERYGIPMEQVLLRQTALIAPASIVGSLLEGVVETALIKRGWCSFDIRRYSSTAGYLLQIVLKIGEVLAPTANIAFGVMFLGVFVGPLHQAGFNLSNREMGGEEAGVYSAVTNCINRTDGVLGPIIATIIKRLTGSWIPVYYVAAVGLAIKAVLYWRFVSVKPARVLYAEQTGLREW